MATAHERERPQAGRSGVGTWFRQAGGFTKRYARELFRDRAVLFWTIGFPVGFYLLSIQVFLGGDVPAERVPTVRAGAAISYGVFGALIAALNSFSEQLGEDVEADRYLQFRALSVAPSADLAGRLTAGIGLCVVAFLAVLPVAALTGATFTLQSAASPVVVAVALGTFAVFWMVVAILVTVAVRNTRYASIVTVSLALVAYMLTGFNGTQPELYQGPDALLNVMPHTLSTRLITGHLVEGSGAGIAPPALPGTSEGIAILAVLAFGSLAVGLAVVRRILYRQSAVPWGVIR